MEQYKLPLGNYIETFVDWLVDNGASFFDAISESLEWMIALFTNALLWFHPIAFIIVVVAIALYFRRSIGLAVYAIIALLLIWNLGYWVETMQTLALVLYATLFCMLIGLPIGIYAAHHPLFYKILQPILD